MQVKDVFLSYQWGKQTEVQYLYKLLTTMGYTCWMDIHEMGGGDSLFDAIDKGIRNCKVVVSHVTSKYALSANCRREVSLSDALNKPIIPLLLDEIPWPPQGPMSMVFTQLLYIDFKDNNKTPQRLWSGSRFDQLIAKINDYLSSHSIIKVRQSVSDSKSSTAINNSSENATSSALSKLNHPNNTALSYQNTKNSTSNEKNAKEARTCTVL